MDYNYLLVFPSFGPFEVDPLSLALEAHFGGVWFNAVALVH